MVRNLLCLLAVFSLLLAGCSKRPDAGEGPAEPQENQWDKAQGGAADSASMTTTDIDWGTLDDRRAAANPDAILRLNNGAEPKTLDPAKMTGVTEGNLATALFEGLVTLHPKTLQPIPGVAKSWELSEDGKTYTFHLRDCTWTNGDPVTAADFLYSWTRVLQPATGAEYAYEMYYIVGAEEFNTGKTTDPATLGMKVIDDKTFQVTLKNPVAYFLELVAFSTYYPVNQSCVEAHGSKWTRPENIVGNGAYVMTEWAPNSHITLERNETYWDKEHVLLKSIKVTPFDNASSVLNQYLNDEMDWISSVPVEKIKELETRDDYYSGLYLGVYYYRFNTENEVLKDVKVRKALQLAINTGEVVKITAGGEKPATSFTPPGFRTYTPPGFETWNVEKAKQLLAEAGYPNGEGFPAMELLYNTSENHKKIAEAIAYRWKQELGIEVELLNQEWKVYLENTTNMNYQIGRAGWIGDYMDPYTFLKMWVTDGGNNRTGWSNAEYDSLLKQSNQEVDPARRMEILQKAEAILLEEVPVAPIYYYVTHNMYKRYVGGVYDNLRDRHNWKYLFIAKQN
jgi:oligopeptide transport system substrate-binding protein